MIRVVTYTNAAKARLMLNGKEVGATKDYDKSTGIIYWDIPYTDGKLEVSGMDKSGKEIARYSIQSSKRPYALKIKKQINSGLSENGLAQVVIEVVDEDGVPVMLADNEVTCHIAGPARLLGLEASNNSDMSDYTDNRHRVFNGQILAYIKASEKGEVNLKFTSPLLKSVETKISFE